MHYSIYTFAGTSEHLSSNDRVGIVQSHLGFHKEGFHVWPLMLSIWGGGAGVKPCFPIFLYLFIYSIYLIIEHGIGLIFSGLFGECP